jgi:hypothetical protein
VTRRVRPIVLPMLPSLALFGVWLRIRPSSLEGNIGPLDLHPERMKEISGQLVGSFHDSTEPVIVHRFYVIAIAVAVICLGLATLRWAFYQPSPRLAWPLCATFIPLACAGVFLVLFLVLPMSIGIWWYVYPREAVSAVLLLLAAFPDLPRSPWLKVPLVLALAAGGLGTGQMVVKNYALFDPSTRDFAAIIQRIPRAPKLLYLIFDHEGSTRTVTPYMHMPAYVQAEKGGWLSFHFAVFDAMPLQYRPRAQPGAVIPPAMPHRFEWRPESFELRQHGSFFNWFLVRRQKAPDDIFRADPSITRVDHIGSWWLYRRKER